MNNALMLRTWLPGLSSASAASPMAASASGAGISASTRHTLSSSMLTCSGSSRAGGQDGGVQRRSGAPEFIRGSVGDGRVQGRDGAPGFKGSVRDGRVQGGRQERGSRINSSNACVRPEGKTMVSRH